MATITARKTKSGTRYTAQIRLKKDGKVVFQETKSFKRKAEATAWAARREEDVRLNGYKPPLPDSSLAAEIQQFLKDHPDFDPSRASQLRKIARSYLGEYDMKDLDSDTLLDWIKTSRTEVAAATARARAVSLRTVIEYAVLRGKPLSSTKEAVQTALTLASRMRLVEKPNGRERRISDAELKKWFQHLDAAPSTLPLRDIAEFALHSARRLGEIVRLRWDDLDEDKSAILVRDVKHPTAKKGNHKWAKLTPEALAIIKRQPKTDARIFPYRAHTLSSMYSSSTRVAGLKDLRFHDLRHEATSRLFAAGYSIPEVQLFTLHSSWLMLQKYTHLRVEDVEFR